MRFAPCSPALLPVVPLELQPPDSWRHWRSLWNTWQILATCLELSEPALLCVPFVQHGSGTATCAQVRCSTVAGTCFPLPLDSWTANPIYDKDVHSTQRSFQTWWVYQDSIHGSVLSHNPLSLRLDLQGTVHENNQGVLLCRHRRLPTKSMSAWTRSWRPGVFMVFSNSLWWIANEALPVTRIIN